jgi:hypothetical protein
MLARLMTVAESRIRRATMVHTHDKETPKATTRAIAARTPGAPPSGRKPIATPSVATMPAARK